jgi:malyl-CoA/(S)-citramalyl-CoA lyase
MRVSAVLRRSELTVPGMNDRALAKARALDADVVCLDLEDSVAPPDKDMARSKVVRVLGQEGWSGSRVAVRINALDTPWSYRDIHDVMRADRRPDLLMVPKVDRASDLEFVATLCAQLESELGVDVVRLEALVETATGLMNVEQIASSCPGRLEALVFGPGDYAASIGARTTTIGGPNFDYAVLTDPDEGGSRAHHWNDQWHYALSRIIVAARANALLPLDGPFTDLQDAEGLRSSAERAAALGCEGKWVIHPSQLEIVNEVFSPTPDDIAQARRIIEAMDAATGEESAAAALDGRMVDIASLRMAENVLAKARLVETR